MTDHVAAARNSLNTWHTVAGVKSAVYHALSAIEELQERLAPPQFKMDNDITTWDGRQMTLRADLTYPTPTDLLRTQTTELTDQHRNRIWRSTASGFVYRWMDDAWYFTKAYPHPRMWTRKGDRKIISGCGTFKAIGDSK